MAKKKIIISRKQLKKLNEVELSVQATQNTSGAYADAVNNSNTQSDLKNLKGSTGSDPAAIISGPTTTDKSPVVDVNVPAGMSPSSVMNNSQEIGNAINGGAAARIHGDGFPMEGVKYTKKQLEEARLANIRKNGRVCTKKTLFEGLGEDEIPPQEERELTPEEKDALANFCKGDFLIYGNMGMRGWGTSVINTREDFRQEVISEIYNSKSAKFTNERLSDINRATWRKLYNPQETKVVKLSGVPSGQDYWIIWEP